MILDGINFESCPTGTRFLYRTTGGNIIMEDVVLEWSGSGMFVKLLHAGWMSAKEASVRTVFLEALAPTNSQEDMCPNCVTPWKCNGPHLS